MSDFWLWLSGVTLGIGFGIQFMLRRQHRFYHWALREAQQHFDQLLAEWAAQQDRDDSVDMALSEAPAWFPERTD